MLELVSLQKVSKRFPGVIALDQVSLSVYDGEVLGLVGENGAGKSTLMKVLSGVYPHGTYGGNIQVNGKEVHLKDTLQAQRAGIGIIHQELSAFPNLTVAENLFVGKWPKKNGLVDWRKVKDNAKHWLSMVEANIDPMQLMSTLSVGNQQLVEIAKALSQNSQVLILDEPTSALTPKEVKVLFNIIRKLKAEGKGLVYISHKMEEIFELTDRITVLRDGKSVFTGKTSELNEHTLISHMVGRSLDKLFPPRPDRKKGKVLFQVKNFSGRTYDGKKKFGPMNFSLQAGEILGFAGLLGAGRSEFFSAAFGDTLFETSGELLIDGSPRKILNPAAALMQNLALVPEDRKHESIFEKRSIHENISISRLIKGSLVKKLQTSEEIELTEKSIKQLRVKCSSREQHIGNLSGGNQQKVIIARSLQAQPQVLILDEPTRGIDVGAKYEIYEILFALAAQGKSLLVSSSDLLELIGICDRIVVMNQGAQKGILEQSDFSQEKIMALAVGAR